MDKWSSEGGGAFEVSVLKGPCPEREQCEAELLGAGVALPLFHRCEWGRAFGGPESWFLAARDGAGTCRGGFLVEVARSHALPKHLLLRVRHCGPMTVAGTLEAAFGALADQARRNSRVLRVNVELFSPDREFRTRAGRLLSTFGFHPAHKPRSYSNTLSIDLSSDEEAIFAQLSRSTRRNIRAIGKGAWKIKPIADGALGPRMEEMRKATLDRTGGNFVPRDWPPAIDFCARHPAQSRLVGLFRTDALGPDALLAYAWGLHHVDHAQYHDSAAVRDPEIKVPLAYGLIWDLICWGKHQGAGWFDMGGVTQGQFGDTDDPLGGISDFKRFFTKTVVPVGEEWEWEPRPTRAKLARIIGSVARLFGRR
jgi:hypothetical protein